MNCRYESKIHSLYPYNRLYLAEVLKFAHE